MVKLFILGLVLASCGTSKTKLSSKAKDVEILTHQPKGECSMVAKVVGVNKQGSAELARNHARNLAAQAGGNAIWIEQEVPNGSDVKVHASAYECE